MFYSVISDKVPCIEGRSEGALGGSHAITIRNEINSEYGAYSSHHSMIDMIITRSSSVLMVAYVLTVSRKD